MYARSSACSLRCSTWVRRRASAGTYAIRGCNVPGYTTAPLGPWRTITPPNVSAVDSCASGGGLGFSLPQARVLTGGSYAALELQAPTDAARRPISVERLRLWLNARLGGTGGDLHAMLGTAVGDGFGTYIGASFQAPGVEASQTPVDVPLSDGAGLQLRLFCDPPEDRPAWTMRVATDCYPTDPVPLEVRGVELTLREDVPPTGSVVGGTLIAGQPASESRSLDYSAMDRESGLLSIEAILDATVVATKDLAAGCSYADFTACPTTSQGTLAIDTRQVANGRHSLILRVFDAARNRIDVGAGFVDVSNGTVSPGEPSGGGADSPPPRSGGPDAVGAARLDARFASSTRSTVVVPFGRATRIRGRLTTTAGMGLGDRTIDVLEKTRRAGASESKVAHVRTRSDGTFSYVLSGTRPSRYLRLVYGALASSGVLEVRVRAASSLTASLRGTSLGFSGRVISLPIPKGGKRVTLQGKAPGFAWASFPGRGPMLKAGSPADSDSRRADPA